MGKGGKPTNDVSHEREAALVFAKRHGWYVPSIHGKHLEKPAKKKQE